MLNHNREVVWMEVEQISQLTLQLLTLLAIWKFNDVSIDSK